jgi:hypothetical protein
MQWFKSIFDSLVGVSLDTILLEACEWDEERAEEIKTSLSKITVLESSKKMLTSKDIVKSVVQSINVELTDKEEAALEEIFSLTFKRGFGRETKEVEYEA